LAIATNGGVSICFIEAYAASQENLKAGNFLETFFLEAHLTL
jgi:hypothetical protein